MRKTAGLLAVVVSLFMCSCKEAPQQQGRAHLEISGKAALASRSQAQWTHYRFVRDSLIELRNDYGDTLRMSPTVFHQIAHEHAAFEEFDSTRLEIGFEPMGKNLRLVVEQRPGVMGLAALTLTAFALTLILVVRQRRKLKEASLERQNVNRQRQLAESSREAERKRLARELHDGPLQDLYALRMQLASAASDPATNDQMILGVADELRALTEQLRTSLLIEYGISEALHELSRQYQRRNQVRVAVCLDPLPPLPEALSTALYRIAQEGCSNAVRHGMARTIDIRLRLLPDAVQLTIKDDGIGFEVPASYTDLAARGHFGLLGQQERVDVLRGRLRVVSALGSGALIQVELPLTSDLLTPTLVP